MRALTRMRAIAGTTVRFVACPDHGAVAVTAGALTLSGVTITDCYGGAVAVVSSLVATGLVIERTHARFNGGGITLAQSSTARLSGGRIAGCSARQVRRGGCGCEFSCCRVRAEC